MQKAKKIILIGGGIGGAATALALNQAEFEPIVYERTKQLGEVGAGVALWANATHVLKKLDVLEEVLRESDLITNYQFNSHTGEELMNLRTNQFEVPAVGIHRADLHALLRSKLPNKQFVLGQMFERFEQLENKIYAHFSGGLVDEGDALIGADGLNSRVRAQLFGQVKPIYRGVTAWRGLTHYVPNTYKTGYVCEFVGHGKDFGFLGIGKGRMYWYAAVKAPEGQADAPVGRKRELQEMFLGWPASIPELIAATEEASILKTDLYDRIPIREWSFSNITLLGDAAHPTLPSIGQGACMAIEDALVVTKCLLEKSNPADAFRQYESLRFARTKMIVEESLSSGQIALLENRAAMTLRNTLMKLLPTQLFENKIKAIHAYRV